MAGLHGIFVLALVLSASCSSNARAVASCSSYHDVSVCKGILDSIATMNTRECNSAETCLNGLSCCCTSDMPFQERIRCRARRRDIGYQIYRLNVKCRRIVVQQPDSPGC